MQRFDTTSAILNGVASTVVAGVVGGIIINHPGLPDVAALIPIGLAAAWFLFGMRRSLRRVTGSDEPAEGVVKTLEQLDYYKKLPAPDRIRFRREVAWFLREQTIEGVGVEVDDKLRGLIAASAVMLTFGLPRYEWQTFRHILVYPDAFDEDYNHGGGGNRAGVVHSQGPIIFSAKSLRRGFQRKDGHNVGLHEFAHVLDLDDGLIDGAPSHLGNGALDPWVKAMSEALKSNPRRGRRVLRSYGYTNAPEFFAVASELFFEKPDALKRRAPELYELLTVFYAQSPASRRRS